MPYLPRHPRRWPRRLAFAISVTVALAWVIFGLYAVVRNAHAAPPDPEHPGPYHKWFESQVIPAGDPMAGSSCCAESDGHVIDEDDWRIADGHYEVRIGGNWTAIPETRVLPNTSNPTGHPVVWYVGGSASVHIYCFAAGTVS